MFCACVVAAVVFFLVGFTPAGSAEALAEPIRDVATIRGLSREDAAQALPVKLSGVVTYQGWTNLVIHDGEASVYLDFLFSQSQGYWKGEIPNLDELVPGTELVIEGVTDPGGFSPMVLIENYQRVGLKEIPLPLRPSVERLLSSSEDTQWVEVEGVVQRYDAETEETEACLHLIVGGYRCPVNLRHDLKELGQELVDARVRVRGVMLNIANLRSQASGLKIHTNGKEDIDIIDPPPVDPFLAPKVTLDRLILFHPKAERDRRKVSSGVVTFVDPGRFFYFLDNQASVRVESAQSGIAPGDLVEVSGFIDTSRVLASFREALVRVIGHGEVPAPEPAMIADILNPETRSWQEMVTNTGYHDSNGRLIRLSGVLRRVLPADNEGNATLVIESDDNIVQAFLPVSEDETAQAVSRWIAGSLVEVTGVCELEIGRIDKLPWFSIEGFHLMLSSPESLRVISTPPWWTPQRLGILFSVLFPLLGLALVWGYALRRQVATRSLQLAQEISAGEASTIKFDTILRERRRLAADLHDTLEQALTGLALHLEITERSKEGDPELSARHLSMAQQFLERSRREVHQTVWDLRAHGLGGRDFLDILHQRATAMVAGLPVEITVGKEGEVVPLPDSVAGDLLLIAQEAVTNALKHASASKIDVCLKFSFEKILLAVTDNGRGFDTISAPSQNEGHFGLQVMHERVHHFGGELEVQSSLGHGSTIIITLPLPPRERERQN